MRAQRRDNGEALNQRLSSCGAKMRANARAWRARRVVMRTMLSLSIVTLMPQARGDVVAPEDRVDIVDAYVAAYPPFMLARERVRYTFGERHDIARYDTTRCGTMTTRRYTRARRAIIRNARRARLRVTDERSAPQRCHGAIQHKMSGYARCEKSGATRDSVRNVTTSRYIIRASPCRVVAGVQRMVVDNSERSGKDDVEARVAEEMRRQIARHMMSRECAVQGRWRCAGVRGRWRVVCGVCVRCARNLNRTEPKEPDPSEPCQRLG